MSIYRIKMNGKTYEMEIELIEEGKPKDTKTAVKNTKPAVTAPEPVISEPYLTEESKVVNPNTVISPMPGSIIKILVESGDEVKKNDVILILEAMKMENEVCAPRDGKIKAIFVTEGQTVSMKAPLFEMEE